MQDDELVTVVIPALDEESFVGQCLDSVSDQDYTALQILVVDGGSTDGTVGVVRSRMAEDDRIELLHNPRRSIPSSLNIALRHARAKWLVRIDAHSTVDVGYIGTAVGLLRRGTWAAVGGRKDGVGRVPAGRAIAAAMSSRFGVANSTYHFGTSVQEIDHVPFGAYRVEDVLQVGGWDERLVANEDFELDYRLRQAGMRLLFDPRMVIHWQCRQSIRALYSQYRRYGKSKVDVARLHPASMCIRHFVPPAFVAYVGVAALLGVRRPAWSLVMTMPYLVALTAASAIAGRRLDSAGDRAYVPLAFGAMHFGWGVGFWSGMGRAVLEAIRESAEGGALAGRGKPVAVAHLAPAPYILACRQYLKRDIRPVTGRGA